MSDSPNLRLWGQHEPPERLAVEREQVRVAAAFALDVPVCEVTVIERPTPGGVALQAVWLPP